jgi:hypothetical protein
VEQQGLGRLIDQRRDVSDVDWLMEIDQFSRFTKPGEKIPERLLHQSTDQ